ncbi:L-type lectin-domain containing receptor kinase IX.1 [Linum perenne]
MSINKDLERGTRPTRFSYQELAAVTNSFSQDRKLGEGGSGAVYKGYLSELDLSVAVKRISKGSKQARKEFLSEVKTIGQLRHRNLVPLVGWCYDEDEFMLVYEGYLAPECITTGRVSKESDVYSFGVVLLEITTGRKVLDPINEEKLEMSLVSWIWHLYECGELISAVDPRLGSEFDYQEAERLLIVGLWCAQSDSKLRPTIHPAIQALKCETLLPILSDIKSSSRRSS